MNEIIEKAPQYLEIAGSVIATAAVIATFTPSPVDNGVLIILKRILDVFAMNFGKARNAK
jgi:hypothetical protein